MTHIRDGRDETDMPFEADLAHALDRTTDSLEPDVGALLRGAVTRGRGLRRRRTAGFLATGAVTCSVVAAAALVVPGMLHRHQDPEPVRAAASRSAITGGQMIQALEGTFPGGRFSEVKGQGNKPSDPYDGAVANASLILDDGKGPASVGVSAQKFKLPLRDVEGLSCDGWQRSPGDTCTRSDLASSTEVPGGAVLLVERNTPKNQAPGPATSRWTVTVTMKSTGAQLRMVQWNSPGGGTGAEVPTPTRTAPPLTDQQAVAALTGPAWAPILSALG